LRLCAERALSYNKAISENIYLRKQLKEKYHFSQIIGTAPKMRAVFKMIERVADTDSTILILGESGTGKELVARSLHFNSRRQFAPFIPVNCSSLPENLLESELFGHRKGAFTGAIYDKKGLFEEADGGTIFLDEIGCMPLLLQSRLLRVLQDREVRRVGDNTSLYINVRVLAATNAPLEKRIKDGTFREDLYYRLNVIPIMLPSLRERREDIPLIAAHFIRTKINAPGGPTFGLTRQVMEALCAYDWPGNVRELENVLQRAFALCENNIAQLSDLPAAVQAALPQRTSGLTSSTEASASVVQPLAAESIYPLSNPAGPGIKPASAGAAARPVEPLKDFLREQELAYLNRALAQTGGDKEKTAGLLGISLATLYRKLSGDEAS
jgi:transcriptional regulator with PAS, ATPase and Fis domain